MTVLTEQSSRTYLGDASTTLFPIPFRFFADSHITAELITATGTQVLVEGAHYTLSGEGDPDGGVLTMLSAPAANESLYIERNTPILQETDLRPEGRYLADDVEEMFDYRCCVEQDLARRLAALEALGDGFADAAAITAGSATVDFLTNATDVEATFPMDVAITGGNTAKHAWLTYLANLDTPSEVFDGAPALQWLPGTTNRITILRVTGLKPATNYRMRLVTFQ